MGEVSISCWTTSEAITTSPMPISGESVPATPVLMTHFGAYLTIMVWAHMAAKTLPIPQTATMSFAEPISPPSFSIKTRPTVKRMPPTVSVCASCMEAMICSASISIAAMMPYFPLSIMVFHPFLPIIRLSDYPIILILPF